ncbi:MAG: VWA domain-containing protein [Nitrososphaerales archaeon]|jgi:VWFA-related protein
MRLAKPALSSLVLILTLPALAQTTPPAPTLKVYARETVVDVNVTDANGNPVRGLTKADFTVQEDGKAQAIRSFEEFGTQPVQPLPKLPPNTYTNLQPPPASSAVNILLLDGLNTAPPDATDPDQIGQSFAVQNRVKQGATNFVKNMPPGTRVVILDLSRGLRILQNVSSNPDLLSAAINTTDMNMDGRAATAKQWCFQQDERNRGTLEALNQIATDTAPIKSKKNLIWFSAGFPTVTDPSVNTQAGPVCLPDYTSDLLKTYSLLAAAQVVVYPVGPRIPGSDIFSPVGPGMATPADGLAYLNYVDDEQLSLESVAEATGGTAYYNTNDLGGAVAKAVEKGSSYYTISYIPPGTQYDGRRHTIGIETRQPGLHLAYRLSYVAIDPTAVRPAPVLAIGVSVPQSANSHPDPEATMRLAMSRAMPTSTQILFDVQVEPSTIPPKPSDPPILGTLDSKLKSKPLTRYGFQYAIPARQISFTPGPNGTHKGSLEVDIAVYDGSPSGSGKILTGLSQTVKMPLSDDKYQQFIQGPFRFFQQLDLPSGQLFVRIGILDPASNKIGTLEIPLTIPKK